MSKRDWLREAGMLALRMLIGLYVLNLGYGFEGSLTQLKEFHFVSDTFTGQQRNVRAPAPPPLDDPPSDGGQPQPADSNNDVHNRFEGTWLGEVPVPFPKNYLLGIDLQRKDFERYSRQSYLRGEWRDRGWWYYYLYAVAIKVPLGLWGLGAFVLFARLGSRLFKSRSSRVTTVEVGDCRPRDEITLLFPGVVIFAFVSSQTGFSEHMRYVLPAFPFFFVWISQAANCFRWNRAGSEKPTSELAPIRLVNRMRFSPLVVAGLVAWFIASSLWIYPHSLSYFNELIGGPLNGPKHLLGSSVDWCQDLRYLKWWTERHPEVDELHLAYHGLHDPEIANFSPTRILPIETRPATHEDGTDAESQANETQSSQPLPPGWYAISVNVLYNQWSGRAGGGSSSRLDEATAKTLRELRPYDRAGYSILIFRL
jgi:hypothetical protein